MTPNTYAEGVRPGGLTTTTEIRILLCYILHSINRPVSRAQLEAVLLGEELVNYFALADSLAQLLEQGLIAEDENGYTVTDSGRTVGLTLSQDVPRTIRDAAVNGLIRALHLAAKAATQKSVIEKTEGRLAVHCSIGEEAGPLFSMSLYMPDELSAETVQTRFTRGGDVVYKLVLAALTENKTQVERALEQLEAEREQ